MSFISVSLDWMVSATSILSIEFMARGLAFHASCPPKWGHDLRWRTYYNRCMKIKSSSLPIATVLLAIPVVLASPIGEKMGIHLDGGELPGMVSIIVDSHGQSVIDCRGYADIGTKSPMRPDTIFWLASNTKAIAAATLMTQVDDGRVELDDLVSKYLPEFASVKVKGEGGFRPSVRPVTVRMTLSHMSGLPFFPGMPIDKRSITELACLAATEPLNADPGEKYAYSNWGIDVAMAIVEKVTGRSFASVMKERILDPLGMDDAVFVPSDRQIRRLAKSYQLSEDKPPREIKIGQLTFPYTDVAREPEGGGGLFGTADDLCRFFKMLVAGGRAPDGRRILSSASVNEITRRQTPVRPGIRSYGFGLNVKTNAVFHGGAYGTYASFNPITKVVCVLCVSMSGSNSRSKAFRKAWDDAVDEYLESSMVVSPECKLIGVEKMSQKPR